MHAETSATLRHLPAGRGALAHLGRWVETAITALYAGPPPTPGEDGSPDDEVRLAVALASAVHF